MTQSLPLVSIIMCCYNGAHFIPRAFASVLNQTYNNIELIFVNDGSTDNTIEVAESYLSKFEDRGYSLKIISQENHGHGHACATGLQHINGVYLSYLDVDDIITPTSIEEKVDFLESHSQYHVVRSNAYIVNNDNLDDTSKILVSNNKEKKQEYIFNDLLFGRTNNYAGTYLVRTNPLKKFYADKEVLTSRYGPNLQVLLPLTYKTPCGFIDKPLFKYIRHNNSHSAASSLDKEINLHYGYWDIRYKMLELMEINDQQLLKDLKIQNIKNIIYCTIHHSNVEQFNSYYKELKELGGNTFEFKVYNANMNNKKTRFIYRILFFFYRHLCPQNLAY